MTKQGKVVSARKSRDTFRDVDSLLVRSAESLGRMIGSLQRQLDGATRQVATSADRAKALLHLDGHSNASDGRGIPLDANAKNGTVRMKSSGARKSGSARMAAAKSAKSTAKTGSRTATPGTRAAARPATTRAAKPASAKRKTTARSGAATRRKTAGKTSRRTSRSE